MGRLGVEFAGRPRASRSSGTHAACDLIWDHRRCDETAEQLARRTEVPPIVARLLCQRGLGDPEDAQPLSPSLARPPPRSLCCSPDMRRPSSGCCGALARTRADCGPWRLRRRRHDLDGHPAPRARAARRRRHRISFPSGCGTATGCSRRPIERLHADGARVIVSVDCGIRSGEAARRARELGVDLIITDHHEPEARCRPRSR